MAFTLVDTNGYKYVPGASQGTTGVVQGASSLQGGASSLQNGGSIAPAGTITTGNVNPNDLIATGGTSGTGAGTGAGLGTGTGATSGPSAAEIQGFLDAISQLDTILGNKNQQADKDYQDALKAYGDQNTIDAQRHADQVAQNEQNLERQRQQALLAGAQGGQGLRSVLDSLGALGGTGAVLANRAIAAAANQDLGNASDTFNTNATSIGNNWADAESAATKRDLEAKRQHELVLQQNEANVLAQKQSNYRDLANLFDQGSAQRAQYVLKANALGPDIARTTAPVSGTYAKSQALFAPADIKNYLAGTSDLTVNTSGAGANSSVPINSPLFATSSRKDKQLA